MKTIAAFALICWLVPPAHQTYNDETETDAEDRYMVIAQAIEDVAGDDDTLQLFLMTVARHESHYKRRIHDGSERGDYGNSWSLFQIWIGKKPDTRIRNMPYMAKDIVGVDFDSTRRAVEVAAGILAPRIKSCYGVPYCVFRTYGGVGKNPDKKTKERLEARVRTYRMLVIEHKRKKK